MCMYAYLHVTVPSFIYHSMSYGLSSNHNIYVDIRYSIITLSIIDTLLAGTYLGASAIGRAWIEPEESDGLDSPPALIAITLYS